MLDRSRSRDRSKTGGAFSPAGLFVTGAQGAWYDPSDFSTLFQNATGTTPVTAVEQPVRLMLDKSKGLVLGPELVTNGDFSDGTTGWTGTNATISEAAGVATVENSGATAGAIHQTLTTVSGRRYVVNFSVASFIGASTVRASANNGGSPSYNGTQGAANYGVGTHTFAFVAAGTTTVLAFYVNSTTVGHAFTIDNISVRELPGNHATAPNDASRPVLRARYNLLTYTEQFDNAGWGKFDSTVVANAAAAPDGATTADKFREGSSNSIHRLNQGATIVSGASYTATVYAKADERTRVLLRTNNGSTDLDTFFDLSAGTVVSGTGTIESAGNGWFRISRTFTAAASATSNFIFQLLLVSTGTTTSYTGDGTSGILIWGASLLTAADQAATGGAYQRVGAATDYDTSNPVWRPYLAFDGSDDSFSTSAIDFSGTDEMTVFAGLTKLSDAATAAFVELSADANSNNGAFLAFVPGVNDFRFYSKGTTLRFASSGTVAAPVTRVYTGQGDISGNSAVLRLNGVQVGSDLLNQGTGNFGNYPLFIGRRNNASLPFNGRLYSLAVLGRTATAAELGAMEAWINGKTGAY